MANSRVVLTPEFRGSHLHVIEPTEFVDKGIKTGKFAYTAEMLIQEADLTKFKVLENGQLVDVDISKVLRAVVIEAWPELGLPAKPGEKFTPLQLAFSGVASKGWPLRRGDAVAQKRIDNALKKGKDAPKVDHYKGVRVMACKSNVGDKTQPPALSVLGPNGKPVPLNRMVQGDLAKAKMVMLGGNYFVAELNIKATEMGGMRYASVYLNSICYTREGEKFGMQGGQLMSRFSGVVGGEAAHDPTAGMTVDSEIPF